MPYSVGTWGFGSKVDFLRGSLSLMWEYSLMCAIYTARSMCSIYSVCNLHSWIDVCNLLIQCAQFADSHITLLGLKIRSHWDLKIISNFEVAHCIPSLGLWEILIFSSIPFPFITKKKEGQLIAITWCKNEKKKILMLLPPQLKTQERAKWNMIFIFFKYICLSGHFKALIGTIISSKL